MRTWLYEGFTTSWTSGKTNSGPAGVTTWASTSRPESSKNWEIAVFLLYLFISWAISVALWVVGCDKNGLHAAHYSSMVCLPHVTGPSSPLYSNAWYFQDTGSIFQAVSKPPTLQALSSTSLPNEDMSQISWNNHIAAIHRLEAWFCKLRRDPRHASAKSRITQSDPSSQVRSRHSSSLVQKFPRCCAPCSHIRPNAHPWCCWL